MCTSIHTKCQDLRDIINKLQEDYDIIQSYGSAFVKDTSLAEAISVLDGIRSRIQNLGNVRLDAAVSQYNNNIEFYRVEYYRDLINQEAQNYNYEASSNIQYYRENWEMTHDLEEGEDYWSYQERADDAAATYKSYNYPDYEISLCNHGETTLSALARCSTYGILKRNGTWTTFETRPSDT